LNAFVDLNALSIKFESITVFLLKINQTTLHLFVQNKKFLRNISVNIKADTGAKND
jgi:hypothetical protein